MILCVGGKPHRSQAWYWEKASGNVLEREIAPNVVSPVARRVLAAAQRALPRGTIRGPSFDEPAWCPQEIHDYQQWLHARLRSSGLAKGLAGGPAFLPDVTDELGWPWRYLARLFAPRTYEQLTRKIAGNLEWYVDQSRPARDLWTALRELAAPCLYLTLLLVPVLFFTTGLYYLNWVGWLGPGLLLYVILLTVLLLYNRNIHRHATNTAELNQYLAEEYSEAEESKGAQTDLDWQQLISSLSRIKTAVVET